MATACLKLLGGWDPPCSVRDLGGPAAPPGQKALFHPQRYAIAGCCARGPARPKAWAGGRLRPWAYDMGAPTQLWHPMKF